MRKTDFSRAAALSGLAAVADDLGVGIAQVAADVGAPLEAYFDPDVLIPNPLIGKSYRRVAELSGQTDIALRVAERRRVSNLGIVGWAMRPQATLLSAAIVLHRFFGLHNEAVGISCNVGIDAVEMQIFARPNLGMNISHLTPFSAELAVGALYKFLYELSEGPLRLEAVAFVHARHAPEASYRRVFGIAPTFEQDFNGVLFHLPDMIRLRAAGDPDVARDSIRMLSIMSEAREATATMSDRVHDSLMTGLPVGVTTLEQTADQLGLSKRTLNRRLARDGITFDAVLQDVRKRTAASLLHHSNRSLLQISSELGFAEQSGFSRWFRRTYGCTPTQYRHSAS